MKLGFITAICEGMRFEEVVDFAAENHLECLEVACWPQGGASRRYAGVSHIDVAGLTQEKAKYINEYCKKGTLKFLLLHTIRTHWNRIWRKGRLIYHTFISL